MNLDPANDLLPYEPTIDISDLIQLEDVANEYDLGPNGGSFRKHSIHSNHSYHSNIGVIGLMYCMEFLEKNFDWLHTKLQAISGTQHELWNPKL